MVRDLIGYRFSPTGEELVSYYLKNKILGKTWLVDEAISEINFLSYIPELLPRLAKIQSDNLEWFFFSRIEYTNSKKKNAMKRSTGCGYWKATGKDRKIKDKRGNGVEIGLKKTLVYHKGKVPNGDRTPWVMHEYHITCLPHHQRNYVICQVKYKGEAKDISYGENYLTEQSHSLVSDSNTARALEPAVEQLGGENLFGMSVDDLRSPMNEQEWDGFFNPNTLLSDDNMFNPYLQPQSPHLASNDDEFLGGLRHVDRRQVEYLFADEEDSLSGPTLSMTENHNDHMPLSEIIVDYSSDSNHDADAISATSYHGASSTGDDTVGSLNRHILQTSGDEILSSTTNSCNDIQTYGKPSISRSTWLSQLTRRVIRLKQKVKQDTLRTVDSDEDSDTDAESISVTSYQGTPGDDSVGSSTRYFSSCSSTDSCEDLQPSADLSNGRETREYKLAQRTVPSKQEVKQGTPRAIDESIMKTEKKGWFVIEEVLDIIHKTLWYIYPMRLITSVLLTVKA
ncbi:PREDICTED: NAC domain-containing protein 69-like isoform X2 [Camelina sativa]|uniref:NAC domain-containing protein 69-like isoform X2 n=1 Tax=Camelina sativa TaxID=90675 RepID=A0ABM0TM74_CAMSA|nr:PREDICTED: NAC domain-containing protein 69-like isoform X2 [Camelina sativa]